MKGTVCSYVNVETSLYSSVAVYVCSNEVPILWVRVDPDFQWIRQLSTEQSDTTWQTLLRHERDAVAQLDALEALNAYPSVFTRDSFRDAILNPLFYYHVRLQAANNLAKVCSRCS